MALLLPFGAAAFNIDFSTGIPASFTTENAGGQLLQGIYRNTGNDPAVAWFAGQLPGGHGRAALSPTRNTDAEAPSCKRLVTPVLHIGDGDLLRWESRSLHPHIPETYTVSVRTAGAESSGEIFSCQGESWFWSTHVLPLADYAGRDIQIVFTATTTQGFMLAVDNIFVGVPTDSRLGFVSRTAHFVAEGEPFTVSGSITNYGAPCRLNSVEVSCATGVLGSVDAGEIGTGQTIDISFDIVPQAGEVTDYTVSAVSDDGTRAELYADFFSCSHFRRVALVDRCSGTWCNNCPVMDLTTMRLQHRYLDELFIVEAHVNDCLANQYYWDAYLSDFCFAIPMLVPERNKEEFVYSLPAGDYFKTALAGDVEAAIKVKASVTAAGEVHLESGCRFAAQTDNAQDRYRIAYMIVGTIHDPANPQLIQQNSAKTYFDDYLYYEPELIHPAMMWYENVPLSTELAFGVPLSLPGTLMCGSEYAHSCSLPLPSASASDLKVLAMVVDTATGCVLNTDVAPLDTDSALAGVECDAGEAPDMECDLLGRRLSPSAKGLRIVRRNGLVEKKLVIP